MLSSISPVGEAARRQRWSVTVASYLVGSVTAGATLGAVMGLLGQPLDLTTGARLTTIATLAAIGLVADRFALIPSLHRQVDRAWLDRYRGWVYGMAFGAQLGVGIVTIVPSNIVWVTWLAAALVGDLVTGAAVGAAFGLGRALPLVWAGRATSVGSLRALLARVDRLRRPAARMTTGAQAVIVVLCVIGAVTAA